jgi:hypothetical protein
MYAGYFFCLYILDIGDSNLDWTQSALTSNLPANHEPPSSMKNTTNIMEIISNGIAIQVLPHDKNSAIYSNDIYVKNKNTQNYLGVIRQAF